MKNSDNKIKAIFSSFQLPILEKLHKELSGEINLDLIYGLVDEQYEADFSCEFPYAIFHSIYRSRKGIPAKQLEGLPLANCSDKLIEYMNSFSTVAYDMMGREEKDGWTFSYNERKWHLLWLVKYWVSVIENLKPDVLFSRNIPHFSSEFVLFKICEFYNIPCLTVEQIRPLGLSFVTNGIGGRSQRIAEYAKNHPEKNNQSERVKKFIDKVTANYAVAIPDYFKDKALIRRKDARLSSKIFRLTKDIFCIAYKGGGHVYSNIKINKNPIYDSKSWLTEWRYRTHLWGVRFKIATLHKVYREKIEAVDFEKPFVFFAPNYQPERTTCPDAAEFGDLLYLIDTISACLPKGWFIYYKEHPTIYNRPNEIFFRGHLYRSRELYERLSSYPNVKLVDENVESFKLIDKSKAVLTATGTAAYEASVRGVPSVMFGETWFSGCNAIFKVSDREQLMSAFKDIQLGYKPKIDDWLTYLNAVENVCFQEVKLLTGQYNGAENEEVILKNIKRLSKQYIDYMESINLLNSRKTSHV